MEISPSTQMAQSRLFDQVDAAVSRKTLDDQKVEGQNVLQLIDSATPAFTDTRVGQHLDLKA